MRVSEEGGRVVHTESRGEGGGVNFFVFRGRNVHQTNSSRLHQSLEAT